MTSDSADTIVVRTTSGSIQGHRRQNGSCVFMGVRYGETTAGPNRFGPPVPIRPWSDIRQTLTHGPNCPQGEPTIPPEDAHSINGLGLLSSEDCLTLNVWTPGCNGAARRPVMVWLHGGGFRYGSASHPVIDGSRLSEHGDVVVVSLNHRLNVFGYLFLDDVTEGRIINTANAGMRDIVLALEWVRDNIAAMGGDPNNVTIFGQSGGGRKVCVLLAMPSATGLFHRAIVQSGAHPRCVSRERANAFATAFLDHIGILPEHARNLYDIPTGQLYKHFADFCKTSRDPMVATSAEGTAWIMSPLVDGEVLPSDPFATDGLRYSCRVPLLIGTNKDEAALHMGRRPDAGRATEDDLRMHCITTLGDSAHAVLASHRAGAPAASPWELLVLISSEDRRMMSIQLAEEKSALNAAEVYMYYFTWESDYGHLRAAHTMEIPFVFRTLDKTPIVGARADRADLADLMSDAWISFARSGRPGHLGLPQWRPYSLSERNTMIFDIPPKSEVDPKAAERSAWDSSVQCMPWEDGSFVAKLRAL